jgi:MscS family membrane protein
MPQNIIKEIQNTTVGGEPLANILWCVGIIVVSFLLRKPITTLFSRISSSIANKYSGSQHDSMFKELTRKPLERLLSTAFIYLAINQLSVLLDLTIFKRYHTEDNPYIIRLSDLIDKIFWLLIILYLTLFLSRIVDYIFQSLINKAQQEKNREKEQLLPLLKDMSKITLGVIGFFWILGSVFGVNIPALITGIGIGGVAIALAAKESVENFFASFIILTDKPFRTGDTIQIVGYEGVVERVGFRSTRLRHANGSLIIIPNRTIIGEKMENLSQRNQRRIQVDISLGYGFPSEKLQAFLDDIQELFQKLPYIQRPAEIMVHAFGENTFQIRIFYFLPALLPASYTLHGVKRDINFAVYKLLDSYTEPKATQTTVIKAKTNPSKEQ